MYYFQLVVSNEKGIIGKKVVKLKEKEIIQGFIIAVHRDPYEVRVKEAIEGKAAKSQ